MMLDILILEELAVVGTCKARNEIIAVMFKIRLKRVIGIHREGQGLRA